MHELSIAEMLVEQVMRHVPAGQRLRVVGVRAGPQRGIDAEAMAFAWQAATSGGDLADSRLELETLPWRMHCSACGRDWTDADALAACACGNKAATPAGSDELLLVWLDVDDGSENHRAKSDGRG